MKCKYYPEALCLTDDITKCDFTYNEYNIVCPYYRISHPELNKWIDVKEEKEVIIEEGYYQRIKRQIK